MPVDGIDPVGDGVGVSTDTYRTGPPTDGEDTLLLRDGGSVAVREVKPSDPPAIQALFAGLSAESLAMRFGAMRGPLSDDEARQMAASAGPSGCGLVALADTGEERVVALARFDRVAGAHDAEFALVVDDAWHGRGMGTALLERLVDRAAADGLEGLWGSVRPGNAAMMRVLHDLGARMAESRGPEQVLVRVPVPADEGLEAAGTARFAASAAASLSPLLRPGAIAVVGASRDPNAPGGAAFRALLASGFPGPIYPVNAAAAEVAGRPAYPTLGALPGEVDLVVVAVPAAGVIDVAKDAAECGARALVVLSSGFAETGPDGAERERDLLHVARTSGLRVLGPNCLGLAITDPLSPLDATFGPAPPPTGHIGLVTQSGGVGIGALAYCAARGLGLSTFVSIGNRADISSNDLIAWLKDDPRTRVILLYLESFGNPRRFARLARDAARHVPIVALKAGRGPAGRRAAGSHTAALAAGEAPTDALFHLAGVVRADTTEELFGLGELLAAQPLPAGPRLAIVSNVGGPAILAADACEGTELRVPAFDDALQKRLRGVASGVAGTANPVDLGPGADGAAIAAAIAAIGGAAAADAILVVCTPVRGSDVPSLVRAVQRLSDGSMPILGCVMGQRPPAPAREAAHPVPWFEFPETAVRALAGAVEARRLAERPEDPPAQVEGVDRQGARRALESTEPGAWLDPEACVELLQAYGIRVARSLPAADPEDAAAAQARLAVPVAVKLASRTVTHKSDVGGVVLGCHTPDEAAEAFRTISANMEAAGRAGQMEGVVVQELAGPGLDLIVGTVADPLFGPLVLVGAGGTLAELWRDRQVALAPVGPRTAAELWRGLRCDPLIDGFRGAPPADRSALEDLVVRLARLTADEPLLAECDLNPVRAFPPGEGVLVLDARARRVAAAGLSEGEGRHP
jgi:acyl-CoA synthetase (NDP forming)/GNAT superfamily N-acetyltransferase